eukprot:3672078-Lingulodinium_polyedra.AAC.1
MAMTAMVAMRVMMVTMAMIVMMARAQLKEVLAADSAKLQHNAGARQREGGKGRTKPSPRTPTRY